MARNTRPCATWAFTTRAESMGVSVIETAYEMRTATATVTPNW